MDCAAFRREAHLGATIVLGIDDADVAGALPDLYATVEAGLFKLAVIPDHYRAMTQAVGGLRTLKIGSTVGPVGHCGCHHAAEGEE